jgi:hypothetical protein
MVEPTAGGEATEGALRAVMDDARDQAGGVAGDDAAAGFGTVDFALDRRDSASFIGRLADQGDGHPSFVSLDGVHEVIPPFGG